MKEILGDAKLKHRLTSIIEQGNDIEESKKVDNEMQNNKFGSEEPKSEMDKEIDDLNNTGEDELNNVYGDKRVLSWSKKPINKNGTIILEKKNLDNKNELSKFIKMGGKFIKEE